MDKQSMVTSADSLFVARKRHIPTLAITSSINDLTVDGAYGIQQELLKKLTIEGDVIVGGKIGLSSKANQEKFGIVVARHVPKGYLLIRLLLKPP